MHIHSHMLYIQSATAVRFCPPQYGLTFLMRSHKTRSTRDRSIPRNLQSFDEILDLTGR